MHVGLAYRYGALLSVKPEWMVYPDARTALWTVAQGDIEAGTEALRIFDAYQAHYPVEQNIWEPVLVEHQFEVTMDVDGMPERYTLRIDLLAEDLRDGALVLVDHKRRTSSRGTLATATGPTARCSPAWRSAARMATTSSASSSTP